MRTQKQIDRDNRKEAYGNYVHSLFTLPKRTTPLTLEEVLGKQIFELGCYKFSTMEFLEDAGITHICDLVEKISNKNDLLKIKGIGKSAADEIEVRLGGFPFNQFGLKFGMNLSSITIIRDQNF